MTDDFEARVRTMLRERAHDVDGARPLILLDDTRSFTLHLTSDEPPRQRPRRSLVIAAVAAVVALVVGLAVVVTHRRHDHPVPPAVPSPVAVRTCAATLPPSWLAQPLIGDQQTSALALSPDGQAVVQQDSGTGPTVELRTTHSTRVVYRVPDPLNHTVQTASTDGRWLVLPVSYLHDRASANGVLSTVTSVVVVDLLTLASHVLATVPPTGTTIDNAVLFDGSVYWDVRASYGANVGTVERYDLSTGKQSVAYRGNIVWLDVTAAGVSVGGLPSLTPTIAADLPDVVRASVGPRPDGVAIATDGESWTWLSPDRHRLYWLRPGIAPRVISTPSDLDSTALSEGDLTTADRIVILQRHVIDMMTGAVATLPDGELVRAASQRRFLMARTQSLPNGPYFLPVDALTPPVCR